MFVNTECWESTYNYNRLIIFNLILEHKSFFLLEYHTLI